ncbi:MAG: hypothetical protein EU529_01320 [Promethearchaeota archaeon]|nr:MAG: hypothetical protein EU529_01320 [Candidatus Lokiarchaeota archaeon]
MIQFNYDNSSKNLENQSSQNDYLQSNNYSPLLNHQALTKSVKRNLWSYELKSMLRGFIDDIDDFKQNIKFKVSGKILDSSTYVLKTKTSTIINASLETQEDIKDTQATELNEEDNIIFSEDYDEEGELFEAFAELESKNLLTEKEKELLKEEKIKRALKLNVSDLNEEIKNRIEKLNTPPKLIYKKVELKDLADALNNVLKRKDTTSRVKKNRDHILDKSKLPLLPENFIANAEKKRANFENRINEFYETLNKQYKGEPIQFLKLVRQPTVKALVEALLCILHLINHKKIELWKQEDFSENSGQNLFLSPLEI